MYDQFLLEIYKLHIFARRKACDLSSIFASRLFLIQSSHVCVPMAEYSGARSVFFIERIFVFFITLFLKKMAMLSNIKPHCHSKLSKTILKILPIYRNNFPKHYALNTFSDCFMHQNFEYFLQN